jgi:hypothetical protein
MTSKRIRNTAPKGKACGRDLPRHAKTAFNNAGKLQGRVKAPAVNTVQIQRKAGPVNTGEKQAGPAAVTATIAKEQLDPNALQPVKLGQGTAKLSYPSQVPASPGTLLIAGDGRPAAELKAESALDPVVLNAITAINAVRPSMAQGDLATVGITAFVNVMSAKVKAVTDGNMTGIEATMAAQVMSLDALFSELANKAHSNIGAGCLEAAETYMRLAFKAQSQCRATAETLGELKNPRPVFAKNFNLSNGNQQINNADGPQQVNNGTAGAAARAPEKPLSPNKLLAV